MLLSNLDSMRLPVEFNVEAMRRMKN